MKKNKLWVKITALLIALAFAASTAYVAIDAMFGGSNMNANSGSDSRPAATRPAATKPVSK